MKIFQAKTIAAALTVASLAGAGCTSTTAPTVKDSGITPLQYLTETFSGSLAVNGSGFYSVVIRQAGPLELTLAAVQTPGGAALSTPVGIGVGIPSGTACPVTTSQVTSPALSAQLKVTLNPGVYCVKVFDAGNLTSTVNFAVRIRHP